MILVVVDTLRADRLSHYGHALPTAEGLDRFRSHATLFTRATAPAPWTAPSTASLLTGLRPARHRIIDHGARLGDEAATLAEILRGHGWNTVGISFNIEVSTATGFAQGFDRFDDHLGESVAAYPHAAELTDRALDAIDAGLAQPFFLYLHAMNTHGPYRVPPERRNALLGRPPIRGFVYLDSLMEGILRGGRLDYREQVDERRLRSLAEQYDTAVRYTTDELGRLFEALEARGLYDRSLIIMTSDHGEELFDHGGFSHGYSLHREVLHVPLYVKLPGQRSPATVDARVSLLDVLPSVAEIAGVEGGDALDGRSLRPLLRGDAAPEDGRVFLHETGWSERCVARAIVSGDHKLIEIDRDYTGSGAAIRLYDLRSDPEERHDLAGRQPERARRLHAELRAGFDRARAASLPEPANALDELDPERLRALGYAE